MKQFNPSNVREQRLKQQCPTLKEAFDRYLKEITPQKKTNCDASLAKIWCNTRLRDRPISFITRQDIVEYRDMWLKEIAPATVVRRLCAISHLFTIAIKEWGYTFIHDPSKLLRKPIVQNERNRRIISNLNIDGYPEDEIGWIIKQSRSKTLPTIVSLAIETAMRRGELVNIHREHIDFDNGSIYVPVTKNGRPRHVPLSPWAKFVLIDYLTKNNARGKIFDVTEGAVTRAFQRSLYLARERYVILCRVKGIYTREDFLVDLRFHDLRHEATSRLAEVYEMHELAKVTGHADTRMLLRYFHPSIEHLTHKLANSSIGQKQFGKINKELLKRI